MRNVGSSRYGWRSAALALAMLLPSLGTSIANVALPSLSLSFGASSQHVQWVVIAYLIAVTALLVTAGRMGDVLGRRRVLLGGMAIFAAASFLAAISSELWILVAARGVQGAGAAAIMALAVAAVGDAIPKERTGSAMGLLGTVSAIGTALGPSLGGLLVAALGWPSVFVVLGIAGLLALAVAYRVLPNDEPVRSNASFDVAGMVLLIASTAAFALAVTITPGTGSSVALAFIVAIGLVSFLVVERASRSPLIQLRMVADRAVGMGLVPLAIVSAIMMTTLVVGPFYLANVLRLGAAEIGLVMTIGPAMAALVGLPAGKLVDRFGSALVTVVGLTAVVIGALLMTSLPNAFGVPGYAGAILPLAAGYAVFQAANNTALMTRAHENERGVLSALLSLARNLGLVVGASAMGALFALESGGGGATGLPTDGRAGLQLTFIVGAAMAVVALFMSIWGQRR